MPAKAGFSCDARGARRREIPAFVGMTDRSGEGSKSASPRVYRMSLCVIGTIFTSTRRLAARPASVSFEAIGCVLP